MLTKEAIEEFQDVYFKEFGIRLSMTEATEKASDLMRLYNSVLSEKEDGSRNEKKNNKNI